MFDNFWFWLKLLLSCGFLAAVSAGIAGMLSENTTLKDYMMVATYSAAFFGVMCCVSLIGAIWAIG